LNGFIEDGAHRISHRFIDECMTLNLWPQIEHMAGKYLIIHGELDEDVPISQSHRLAEVLGERAELICLAGVAHGAKELDAQSRIVSRISEWVEQLPITSSN